MAYLAVLRILEVLAIQPAQTFLETSADKLKRR